MATIDSNNCIPTGLRADIMRSSMENKNLLSKKGSIYVGTGETVTVGGEKIYKTKALELGSSGQVLIVKDGELKYSTLTNESFDSSTDYSARLKKTFNNFPLQPSNFNSQLQYPNLKLSSDNFNSQIVYSNLYNYTTTPVSGPYGCEVQLQQHKQGYMDLVCTKPMGSLVEYQVNFYGVSIKTGLWSATNATISFSYVTSELDLLPDEDSQEKRLNKMLYKIASTTQGVLRTNVTSTDFSFSAYDCWLVPFYNISNSDMLAAIELYSYKRPINIYIDNTFEQKPVLYLSIDELGAGRTNITYSDFDIRIKQYF